MAFVVGGRFGLIRIVNFVQQKVFGASVPYSPSNALAMVPHSMRLIVCACVVSTHLHVYCIRIYTVYLPKAKKKYNRSTKCVSKNG